MFNSLQVSNSIEQQVPDYLSNEYPNFINFFKDYYRFLETNGNALDLLNGLTELVDIDTYSDWKRAELLYKSLNHDSDL